MPFGVYWNYLQLDTCSRSLKPLAFYPGIVLHFLFLNYFFLKYFLALYLICSSPSHTKLQIYQQILDFLVS